MFSRCASRVLQGSRFGNRSAFARNVAQKALPEERLNWQEKAAVAYAGIVATSAGAGAVYVGAIVTNQMYAVAESPVEASLLVPTGVLIGGVSGFAIGGLAGVVFPISGLAALCYTVQKRDSKK